AQFARSDPDQVTKDGPADPATAKSPPTIRPGIDGSGDRVIDHTVLFISAAWKSWLQPCWHGCAPALSTQASVSDDTIKRPILTPYLQVSARESVVPSRS